MNCEVIAHRGASREAPENTLAAVQLAWKQQADAVEIDVQFSKDNVVVVIHDDNVRKVAGLNRKVASLTLAELQDLDVGHWKAEEWRHERIPTFAQVLAAVPERKRLFVEIKCGPESLPAFAQDYRRSGKKPAQIVPIGFSLPTMKRLKELLPELQVCWVAEFKRTWNGAWVPTAESLIRQAKEANLDGLDLSARGPVNREFVQKVHAVRLKLYIWTVDSPAKARALVQAGVDGITTNRPGWLRAKLGG